MHGILCVVMHGLQVAQDICVRLLRLNKLIIHYLYISYACLILGHYYSLIICKLKNSRLNFANCIYYRKYCETVHVFASKYYIKRVKKLMKKVSYHKMVSR